MIRTPLLLALVPVLMLGACNRNTAPGNDREAQIDAAPTPAPVMPAAQALSGIATEAIAVETMTDADLAALGGPEGKCLIRLTEVGFPSFVHDGLDGTGVIKLNGKLIPLTAERAGMFSSDGLRVAIRPVERDFGSDGMREAEMILMLPGASDEHGYRGYEDCAHRAGRLEDEGG
ncbi:DUF6692 family protein [Sphingosinithalassobacter sp. CS137]|uniref:DUF6692 family protein n=1 Tax=Sphingosinithalassobacter sp. CS137 TaxID=2762748 RepID=UPI00165D7821|nr:DUF6692 family protein [Sphingosinithalassobacter sp. CS137]